MRRSNIGAAVKTSSGGRSLLTFKSALSARKGAGWTANSPPELIPASHYQPCPQRHQMTVVLRFSTLLLG